MADVGPSTNFQSLVKIVPVSLAIMIAIDLWFSYHNAKLHSWFALLVIFPTLTLLFELILFIRFVQWMFDQSNQQKMNSVSRSIRHLIVGQCAVAFSFWILISFSVHSL